MHPHTVNALLALNRRFYERFASDFARTRRTWPPGFDLILPYLEGASNVLDLGCGNGRLLAFLGQQGWQGRYGGIDSSEGLLAEAANTARQHAEIAASFIPEDLFGEAWVEAARPFGSPDAIVSLAVLHHVPGAANRVRFLSQCAGLLAPGGRLIVSTWQFMTSDRLRRRTVGWDAVGIDEADLEKDDYLVGWGEGAAGVRYCAFIDREALLAVAQEAGLACEATLFSDGHEGNLNLYGVFSAR